MKEREFDAAPEELALKPKLPALLEHRAEVLLEKFGEGKASPGSGSAAALMGLLSVKLIQTVCKISMRKIPQRASLFEFIAEQAAIVEPQLKSLFQDDAEIFDRVVQRRIERDRATTPTEKARLSRLANDDLEIATEFSLDIGDLCLDLLPRAIELFRQGWGAVRGDSGAAISAAVAGATSALFISNLNLKSLIGRRATTQLKARADEGFARLQELQQEVFACLVAINDEATTALIDEMQLSLDLPQP